MAGIEDGIAAALAYAANDTHGYELRSGNHWPGSYSIGTDCAGLARLYAAAVEGVALDSYPDFGTWDEVPKLTARGWRDIKFSRSAMRRGDILVRALGDSTGHTVVYLGNGHIVGAESNWDGVRGDSSGAEVTERSYYDYSYNHILRWTEASDMTDEQAKQLAEVYHQVTRTDDPSGRGVQNNDHDHIKWIAAGQAAQNETLAAIVDALGKVTDKLDAVIEGLSAKVDRPEAGKNDAEAEEK